MKTPEDWLKQYIEETDSEPSNCHQFIVFIKSVQSDTWLAAMINAAAIADRFADYDETRDGRKIAKQILKDTSLC